MSPQRGRLGCSGSRRVRRGGEGHRVEDAKFELVRPGVEDVTGGEVRGDKHHNVLGGVPRAGHAQGGFPRWVIWRPSAVVIFHVFATMNSLWL